MWLRELPKITELGKALPEGRDIKSRPRGPESSPKEEASAEPRRVPGAGDGKLALGPTADSSLENTSPCIPGPQSLHLENQQVRPSEADSS